MVPKSQTVVTAGGAGGVMGTWMVIASSAAVSSLPGGSARVCMYIFVCDMPFTVEKTTT